MTYRDGRIRYRGHYIRRSCGRYYVPGDYQNPAANLRTAKKWVDAMLLSGELMPSVLEGWRS